MTPLNVDATPYEPTPTLPTLDAESHVNNSIVVLATLHTEDTTLEHGNTVQSNPTEPSHIFGNVT